MSRIIIGDIHGCFETFKALLAKLPKDIPITLVGDLIDRGPLSAQVVDYVIANNIDCVMGNHEDMLVCYGQDVDVNDRGQYITNRPYGDMWLTNGGHITLKSYYTEEGKFRMSKYSRHKDWMANLPVFLEYTETKDEKGNYLVVSHSVVLDVWQNRTKNEKQFNDAALWGRDFSSLPNNTGIYNVIGHTPQQGGANITNVYSNVDTGACFKDIGYGTLTALQFPEMTIFEQENID